MYHRKNIDICLSKEFKRICEMENEKERIKALGDLFHLDLKPSRHADYEIIASEDKTVNINVKDKLTGTSYYASFDNSSPLINGQARHVKFVNISIQYINGFEREKVFYRFMDLLEFDPLHDEVYVMFDNQYRLTLAKKYPKWYRPIEEGIYLTLSDVRNYTTVFHTKILSNDEEFFEKLDARMFSFDCFVQEFFKNKDEIFNKIMAKLDVHED